MSKLDLAAIRARYERLRRGDTSRWKPAIGTNQFRIVEFTHGKFVFIYVEGIQHFGVRRYSKQPVECPKALFGGDCAIDDLEEQAAIDTASFSLEDLELIKKYDSKQVFYFNVVDMKHLELGCQIWPASGSLAREVMGIITATDKSDKLLYPDITSMESGITLQLENSGQGFDRYTLTVAMQQDGDYFKIARSALPPELKPIDLFAYVKAPCYAYTEAVIAASKKEDLPEAEMKSRLDVMGEPKMGDPNWRMYMPIEEETAVAPAPKVTRTPPTTAKAPPPPAASKSSILDRFKAKKTTPPVPIVRQREPMIGDSDALPWCCGFFDDEKQTTVAGQWAGENGTACGVCAAAEMCKEFTNVETGLEDVPFDGRAQDEDLPPGFPEDEAKQVRADKAESAKSAGKVAAAASGKKTSTSEDLIARLRAKKASKK